MYVATERETSDNTEATRFSQCTHDQRRRLEAEDCNSIRCAQLISGGRRRIRPCPPHCLAHARPTMCCIRLVIMYSLQYIAMHKFRMIATPPQADYCIKGGECCTCITYGFLPLPSRQCKYIVHTLLVPWVQYLHGRVPTSISTTGQCTGGERSKNNHDNSV